MNIFARRTAFALLLSCVALSAHAQVVVSQVWGAAGSGGAAYDRDYVELFNRGASPASLSGLSVQYASATGTGNFAVASVLPAVTLQPGQHFLVGLATGTGTTTLPTPDATGTTNLSGSAGKVALVNSTSALACNGGSTACNATQLDQIVDLVGFGTANFFEGAAAAPAASAANAAMRALNGCTDTNNNGADFAAVAAAPRNSASPATSCTGGGLPVLTISDASGVEGDGPGTTFSGMLLVSLSEPAGPGGVSFNAATADGTATAGEDYVAQEGWGGVIPEGETMMGFVVPVYGDTTQEANETFVINVTDVSGAIVGDAQGVGTIVNDDVTLTPIHEIQGNGVMSPLVDDSVTTRGIVTGRKGNGFFIQTADADADADPLTSQGVFVFTSSAPPVDAAVGNLVQVSATVVEYIPAADPGQAPLTELSSPTVALLSVGNPLPAAVGLTTNLPDPAGGLDQLERFEGMRVTAPSFTVVAPTKGNTNEPNATGTSNGIFNVVVTGVARPFREAGIQMPDPDPTGTTATAIPRWDFNPELITVDSDALGGMQLEVSTGAVLTNLVGPLDFGFRRYTLLAEPGSPVGVAGGLVPTAARLPNGDEFTVASYNLERFFDTVNDPAVGEPVLTAAAFANRLNKASLAIRNSLNTPDIVGVVEVENLSTLQALATKINDDAVAASQPNPQYTAHLMEGNDVGGIDVGFLLKSAEVGPVVPRVEFEDLLQLGKDQTWLDPSDNTQKLLNDRPPLLLQTIIHFADGRKFPLTVIVVHQRSLNGSTSEAPDGVVTEGFRVRAKRQAQAEFLANEIQLRQSTSDPAERIVVVGDFNAFEFNDGLTDAMNVVEGTPTADNETAVNGDGADLVTPDLINLAALEPATERYSFVFDGNAQSLDHVLINELLAMDAGFHLDHARINADFPETNRNDANSPSRLSDHDPAVAYFSVGSANLTTTAPAAPGSVNVGDTMTFDFAVTNNGPDAAESVGVGFALDAEVADLGVTAPAGWTCDTPTVGTGTTTVACNATSLANAAIAAFQLTGTAPASEAGNTINVAMLAIAGTPDPDETDNDAATAVAVLASSDLEAGISGPVRGTSTMRYDVAIANLGTADATGASVRIRLDVPHTATTAGTPAGWACAQAATSTLDVTCSKAVMEPGTVLFPIHVVLGYNKSQYRLRAEASSGVTDPNPANNAAARRLGMPQL